MGDQRNYLCAFYSLQLILILNTALLLPQTGMSFMKDQLILPDSGTIRLIFLPAGILRQEGRG